VVALDSDAELDELPPLDAVADTVGGETMTKLLSKLKPGGSIGSVVGEPAGASQHGLSVRLVLTHPDAAQLAALSLLVADGKLVMPILMRMPLAHAAEAQSLAERHAAGKVLLTGRPEARAAIVREAAGTP